MCVGVQPSEIKAFYRTLNHSTNVYFMSANGRGCDLMRDVVQWFQRLHRMRLSSSFRDEDEPENLFLFDSVT
jgi:hypothetical protein